MLSCQAHGGIDTARQTGKNLVCWLLWSDGSHFSAWALYPAERRWTLMKKVGRQHSALLCCFAQTGVCFFFQLFKKWSVIYSTFNLIVIAKKIPKNKLKYIYHTYLCVSRNRNSQPSQEERELMSVWHFAGICGALNHFYVWDLGFWYLPLPRLSELLARYSDCGTLYVCSCCWPVQGLRFFKPAAVTTQIRCQEPIVEQWPGTLQILALQ